MKPPIYMAVINLSGLYSVRPIKLTYSKQYDTYVNKSQDWIFDPSHDPIGFSHTGGCTQYVSYNKSDVALWLSGAEAVLDAMKRWCDGI